MQQILSNTSFHHQHSCVRTRPWKLMPVVENNSPFIAFHWFVPLFCLSCSSPSLLALVLFVCFLMLFVRSLGNEPRLCVINYSDHQVLFSSPLRLSPPSPPLPPTRCLPPPLPPLSPLSPLRSQSPLSPLSLFLLSLQNGWGTIILPDAEEDEEKEEGQKGSDDNDNKKTMEVVHMPPCYF